MNNILIQGFSEQATKIFHNLSKSILFCQQQTRKMFSFCCGESKKDQYYTVLNKNNRNSQPQTYNYIDEKQARSFLPHMQILKVKQSQYLQLVSHYSNGNLKWEDISFPPNSNSLGKIPQIKDQSWKRLSEIISNPVLFDGRIEPQDAIQGSLGDCYFLSAVSALAEKQERIRRIFGDQPGSKNGIYRVILRINGIIEEIIIDDYVPVNKQGVPIFCQPNKNEIWVPLFEKAWAKANGSYENIISGIPTQIFKAATYSPSQLIQTGSTKEQNERLWKIILDSAKKDRACCGGTCDDEDILWGTIGLVQGHAYTLIDAAELTDKENNRVRVLKLRNPWGNTQWSGEGNENDTKFWNMIKNNEEKQLFLKDSSVNNDGIFYILFKDYCKFFNQTHICYMQKDGNYVFQNYKPSKKGAFWKIQIFNEGQYIFQLHQEGGRSKQEQDNILSRGTLLLIKKSEKYQFISGTMAYFQQDISLKAKLQQGSYILYSKFDLSLKTKKYPQNASISIYSLEYAIIQLLDTLKCKQILRQAFISYGKQNKKKKYEDGTLWISNKLLFKQGGYAFVVFGVEKQAKFKWQVKFNQSDFSSGAFKLKKPYKRKGQNQIFEVLPGKQEIILVRIKNQNVKNVKFPPPIEWKMLSL